MTVTQDLPRLPSWKLVSRIVRDEAGGAIAKLAIQLGLRRTAVLSDDDLAPPDSVMARNALALVCDASPLFLVNHGLRSYAYAVAFGRAHCLRFDSEVLFVAAIMHDLGLTSAYDGPAPFELQGARAARDFLLTKSFDVERADLVHEAIALHAAVGVASKGAPEVQLCHFGTGVDVAGIKVFEFKKDDIDRLLVACPRHGFKCGFVPLIQRQAVIKPNSSLAGAVALGFDKRVMTAPFPE